MKYRILAVLLFCAPFCAHSLPQQTPPGYRIETVETPEGVAFEAGGIAFADDGAVYACTRDGNVWTRKNGGGRSDWKVFARGLQDPLGIVVDHKPGHVFVVQRTELTELVDEDGDGVADFYHRINGDWGFDGNYHEFAHGLVRDFEGSFYLTLNLGHGGGGIQGSIMSRMSSPYRGWAVKITPDGKFHPFASGFRSPVGIGMNDKDEVFVVDSQGDWMATSPIYHVVEGRFYGHPSSLADHPDFKGKDLNTLPTYDFERIRTMPAVWVPYGELAQAPCQPVFDYTHGKFGPFAGQMFVGDQTKSNVMRVAMEKVNGEYQGAIFNFAKGLQSGYVRGAFAPDGSLWMTEEDHGWSTAGGKPYATERLVWDGVTVPFEMQTISLTKEGFRIEFTKPITPAAATAAAFTLSHWHYLYQGKYGSPKIAETPVIPTAVNASPDGKSLELKLPLIPGEVYAFKTTLKSGTGEELANDTGWYTLNQLRK